MNVPVGTLACVYAFWFFLGENWKNVYQQPTDGVSDDQTRDLPGSRWEPYVKNDEGEVVFRSIDPPDWR